MTAKKQNHPVSEVLISWYEVNKRALPWRETNDPYKIWLSEIILQQTRVAQGLDYYMRFVERFPAVADLANASEDEVLKLWQGLGYYSRARNLHKAAKQIVLNYNGIFPAEHKDVLHLTGVGDYTAAAICSFAYDQPYAVVDGNVYRVLARLFGVETAIDSTAGKKEFAELAAEVLNEKHPASHNQAIMEFGALQCVPSSPDCSVCPLSLYCRAYSYGTVAKLPVKAKKTQVTQRYFNYLYIHLDDTVFLQKRTAKDVWQNLYEFPLIEADRLMTSDELVSDSRFTELFGGLSEVHIQKISNPVKHVLSHRVINAQFVSISIDQISRELQHYLCVPRPAIDSYAVSRLIEQFLEEA